MTHLIVYGDPLTVLFDSAYAMATPVAIAVGSDAYESVPPDMLEAAQGVSEAYRQAMLTLALATRRAAALELDKKVPSGTVAMLQANLVRMKKEQIAAEAPDIPGTGVMRWAVCKVASASGLYECPDVKSPLGLIRHVESLLTAFPPEDRIQLRAILGKTKTKYSMINAAKISATIATLSAITYGLYRWRKSKQ